MDLDSRMYIAFGPSMRSEREAYDRAMDLLAIMGIHMKSIRSDWYHSLFSSMDKLIETKIFVIPKKNTTLNGSQKWKETMKNFFLTLSFTSRGSIREVITNHDLQETRRRLNGIHHTYQMTGQTMHHSAPVYGTIC